MPMKRTITITLIVASATLIGLFVFNKIVSRKDGKDLFAEAAKGNFEIAISASGEIVPEMSDEFIQEVSERYIELYEKITGEKFIRTDISNVPERIERNCRTFLKSL